MDTKRITLSPWELGAVQSAVTKLAKDWRESGHIDAADSADKLEKLLMYAKRVSVTIDKAHADYVR